ncbi:MAG TPA: LUD domain-containing protein [Thermomicrobiales bacterium]|nr:LUD domain-containing protein [Thermomicrobiales bacterium]
MAGAKPSDARGGDAAKPDGGPLLTEFAARAEAVGTQVGHVGDGAAAASWIAAIARDVGAERAMTAAELLAAAPALATGLEASGIETPVPSGPDEARDTPLGISLGRLAIAETGSMLLAEPTLADRSIGLLCLAQIIVAPTDALVASLDDAAPVLRNLALHAHGGMATLVTGPSRTADIERVLTVGVQGPGRVFVLFVDRLD